MHEGHQPDLLVDLADTHLLTRKDVTEVDRASADADANIAMVMKAGTLYDADTLYEIWPEKKPFGAYYWVNLDQLRNDTLAVDIYDKK